MLEGVAGLGGADRTVAAAAVATAKPLRAFIGHVEPTFDWTLRQPETGQVLANTTVEALYNHMHRAQPEPVGMAFNLGYQVVDDSSSGSS